MFDPQALPQDLLSTHHLTMFRLTPGHLQVTSVLQPSQPQGLEGSVPLPYSPFTLSTCSSWSCPALVPERKGSQLSVWKWPRHPWQPRGCGLTQHHNSSPVLSVVSPPLCLHLPSGADYGGLKLEAQSRQNNGSTKHVLVLIPGGSEYVRGHDVMDWTVLAPPQTHVLKLVMWQNKKCVLDLSP